MKKIIFLFLVLFSSAFSNTKFPSLSSQIMDMANLLSKNTKLQLIQMLENEERKNFNQIVIATVSSLNGAQIEEYSINLARYWGVGQKNKNNGVLVLIAPNERKIRIEVGYGLEPYLTDKISHKIINYTMLPLFKKGDFNNGVLRGVKDILNAIKGGEFQSVKSAKTKPIFISFIAFFISFVIFIFGKDNIKDFGKSLFASSFIVLIIYTIFNSLNYFSYITILTISSFFIYLILNYKAKIKVINSDKIDKNLSYEFDKSFNQKRDRFSGKGGNFGGGGASGSW